MKDDDFKLFRGFGNGQMEKRMDIYECRVAFATERIKMDNGLLILLSAKVKDLV